jgi:hypothetical protein
MALWKVWKAFRRTGKDSAVLQNDIVDMSLDYFSAFLVRFTFEWRVSLATFLIMGKWC